MPGDCSPSRSVVSKISTRLRASRALHVTVGHPPQRDHHSCRHCSFLSLVATSSRLRVCGYAAATRYSPRGGRRRRESSENCNDMTASEVSTGTRYGKRTRGARAGPAPGRYPRTAVRPSTKPSEAAISSTTASGTGASVVTTIAAKPLSVAAPCPGRRPAAPDGGGGDVDAVGAEDGAHPADHPGHIGVAEDGHVGLELDRESLPVDLREVRHPVGARSRSRPPPRARPPATTATRISSWKSSASQTDWAPRRCRAPRPCSGR